MDIDLFLFGKTHISPLGLGLTLTTLFVLALQRCCVPSLVTAITFQYGEFDMMPAFLHCCIRRAAVFLLQTSGQGEPQTFKRALGSSVSELCG